MLRIIRFAEAIAEHVADGCTHVSRDELAGRLAACEACPFRHGLTCGHDSVWTWKMHASGSYITDCPRSIQ